MVALSTTGVLLGLVPPLALGALVNALVERNDPAEAWLLAGMIVVAIVLGTAAYIASDGLFANNAALLYRNVRLAMFRALRTSPPPSGTGWGGVSSRFISDAETLSVGISLLDRGTMLLVEFVTALVALGLFAPWTVLVVAPELLLTWIITRRMQEPAAAAGQRRQEALEQMTKDLERGLADPQAPNAAARIKQSFDRLRLVEVKAGWLQALNLQGSGGLAAIGPIAAVVAAAFTGVHQAGTLLALYLLALRVFWGFDGLVDLSLGLNSVRGAVERCFEVMDSPGAHDGAEGGVGAGEGFEGGSPAGGAVARERVAQPDSRSA